MYEAGDLLKSGRVSVAAASSGANTLVSAVTGKRIRVTSCVLTSNGTVNAKFQSDSTDISGLFYELQATGFTMPHNPNGWVETAIGGALNLNLSAAIAVGGILNYQEVS